MATEAVSTSELNVMPQRSKRAIWPWVLAGVAVLALAGVLRVRAMHAAQKPMFDTVSVDHGHIFAKVTASGTLSALVTVQVGSQVSGRVEKVFVDYNAEVHAGQLVARIDPQFYQAALEQARANLLASQASLKKSEVQALDADRQFQRSKSLATEHLVAQADTDTAEANALAAHAQVDSAQGALEQARASLHQAEVNLAYCDIVSPINGVVVSRSVDVGQTVAAQFQVATLFTIANDLRKMQVDTSVSEADIGKLRPGMAAQFTVDAYPGERFKGSVRQIRHAAQTVQNVVTYDAVLDVDNPDLKLEPGMTANVMLVYAEKDDALRVPSSALRFKPTPELLAMYTGNHEPPPSNMTAKPKTFGESYTHRSVWVLRNNAPVEVPIVTGVSDGTFTEVQSGELHAGEALIIDTVGAMPKRGPF